MSDSRDSRDDSGQNPKKADVDVLHDKGSIPMHVGATISQDTGIPVADYWGAIVLYVMAWSVLAWMVVAGATKGNVIRDLTPLLWGFGAGALLLGLEFMVSVKAAWLLGLENRDVDFYKDKAGHIAEAGKGPFEAIARRADIIATTCFNVAACVITWAVYITTSAIGGGARQLQWNILAFTVALLAGGTAMASGNIPAFERSLFARQRALVFAISLAVTSVMHSRLS